MADGWQKTFSLLRIFRKCITEPGVEKVLFIYFKYLKSNLKVERGIMESFVTLDEGGRGRGGE